MGPDDAPGGRIDTGLLILRVGAAVCLVLALALPQADAAHIFASRPGRAWPLVLLVAGALVVAIGVWTRPAAGALSVAWAWASYSGLQGGQPWNSLPIRADLFIILYATLVVAGPGLYAIHVGLPSRSARWCIWVGP